MVCGSVLCCWQVLGHWDLGFYTCLAWTGSDVTLSTASILHLCAIALHRYHGIAYPLRMRSASESRRVAMLIAPAWLIAVALSVPLVVQAMFNHSHVLAPLDPAGGGAWNRLSCGLFNRTFAVYSSLVSFFIPLAVMIVADFRSVQILRNNIRFPTMAAIQSSAAHRPRTLRQTSGRSRINDDDDDGDGDGNTEIHCSVRRTASSNATSTISVTSPEVCARLAAISLDVHHKPEVDSSADSTGAGVVGGEGHGHPAAALSPTASSQSSVVHRGRSRSKSLVYIDMLASCGRSSKVNSRERRAEKTLIWVFAAFVALWLPFFCANLAYGACGGDGGRCNVPPTLFAVFTWLGYMSSGVNPCIYTLLNRDFRVAFRHLLMCQLHKLRTANATSARASVRFSQRSSSNGSRRRHASTAVDGSKSSGLTTAEVVITPSAPLS